MITGYACMQCGSDEFYQVSQATKKLTPEGTWLYIPSGSNLPGEPRRRRRRRGHGPPSSAGSEPSEQAESETLTHDPTVDPGFSDAPSSLHRRAQPRRPLRPARPQGPPPQTVPRSLHDGSQKPESSVWDLRKGPDKGVRWKSGASPAPQHGSTTPRTFVLTPST